MKRLLLFIVLLFYFLPETKAEHIIGGDMTYACIGDGLYNITLTIYRDDSTPGAPFDTEAQFPGWIGIFDGEGFFMDSVAIGDPFRIDTLESALDPCIENPPTIAVQRGVYLIENVSLSPSQKWFLKYSRCCRRNGISNLTEAQNFNGNSFVIEIPKQADAICNNGPIFNNEPPPFQCFGIPLAYDASAMDIDGDQLVYELCEPLGSSGAILAQGLNVSQFETDIVAYANGYTFDDPFGGDGEITLDPNTGRMTLLSDFQGFYTISYCVKEFRNGVLIATYPRDFLFLIDDCIIPFRAVLPERISECKQFEVCFENNSTTSPPGLPTIYTWDFGDPTTTNDVLVTSMDTTVCYDYTNAGTGSFLVTLTAEGTQANSCISEDTLTINVYPFTQPGIAAVNGCADELFEFAGFSFTAPEDEVLFFNWDFNNDGVVDQTGQSVNHQFTNFGSQQVQMTIETQKGCLDTVQKIVEVYAVPNAEFEYSDPCIGAPLDFVNQTTLPTNDGINYLWNFSGGNPVISAIENPQNITFPFNQIYAVEMIATTEAPFGCDDTISREIFVTEGLDARFSVPSTVCANDVVLVTYIGNGVEGDFYEWDFGVGATILSGEGLGPYNISYENNTDGPVSRTIQLNANIIDCSASEQLTITVNPNPEPAIVDLPRFVCQGDSLALFFTSGNNPPSFEPALNLIPNPAGEGFLFDPNQMILNIDYVGTLEFSNQYSCINFTSDTVTLKRPADLNFLPIDPIYCRNRGGEHLIAVPTGGVFSGDAIFTNGEIFDFNPLLNESVGIHQLNYTFENQFGCISDSLQTIEVINPNIRISDDVTIHYGDTYQIEGVVEDFGYDYDLIWTPSDSLSCDDCPSPLAFPEITTEYSVSMINENGCLDERSILIKVFVDHGIFIPTAFTPNGDQINDAVHVNGRDIVTVKNFSIYNRWGGKIFEAIDVPPNDPAFGWDGTLDGEDQNAASYVYHAEVQFVDGFVAKTEGSILLLR